MTILLSTQANISSNDGLGGTLGEIARDLGVTGFPGPRSPSKAVSAIEKFREDVAGTLNSLMGRANAEQFDPNFVGSGRQVVPGGGNIESGKVAPLESASVRKVYSQTPQASVIIKKRAFASLNHLYDPTLMDDSEKWLFRATKRLFLRKCSELQDYETLTKIQRLADAGASSQTALLSLVSNLGSQLQEAGQQTGISALVVAGKFVGASNNFLSSAFRMEKIARDREPVSTTTWFVEPDLPILPELGVGSGVFEITLVNSLNTSLSIDGSGSCSVSLQNPYNIMMVTEHDIEMAIRDTALGPLVSAVSQAAGLALSSAQGKDAILQQSRQARGRSAITFTMDVGAGQGVTAIIDALGFQITEDNLDLVPKGHELDATEQALFKAVLDGLQTYSSAMRRDLAGGTPLGGGTKSQKGMSIKKQMTYARSMMRKFYLGRLIIQPWDTIHIFLDGGTRRPGETEEVGEKEFGSFKEGFKSISTGIVGNITGMRDGRQIDDRLLRAAWKQSGKHLRFADFKKLSTDSMGGTHVFAGLVTNVSDSFDDGIYTVSVSANSNIEWLRFSRYNSRPSLGQTQGIIYDPLTPFDFKTDDATGLPTGKPVLTATNKEILARACRQYQSEGKKVSEPVKDIRDIQQDFKLIDGSLIPIFDIPPGLKYKWKEGIVTATYNISTVNPLDKTTMNARQLRRDIGFFASNTAFDNMDVANIISTLVTGFPYNPATFVRSGVNTGAFALDTTLNNGKDYFHNLIDVQRSVNRAHGNWTPFKPLQAGTHSQLAEAIRQQRRLSGVSSLMKQLRSNLAKVEDEELRRAAAVKSKNLSSDAAYAAKMALAKKKRDINAEIAKVTKEITKEFKAGSSSATSPLRIAGNDVSFDLGGLRTEEDFQLFGDELLFVAQRRREDVIRNRDKNLFIVSDEYDRDFDIQAFNLQMARNSPNMWKSSWDDVLDICQKAAGIIDFEFFVNTQGHLELRPPQYNRTPVSVLDAMMSFNRRSGIQLFPDFIKKLVQGREQTLLKDIRIIEWNIKKEQALLGRTDPSDTKNSPLKQFLTDGAGIEEIISERRGPTGTERDAIKKLLGQLRDVTAVKAGAAAFGLFSFNSQLQLQRDVIKAGGFRNGDPIDNTILPFGNEAKYNKAIEEISNLTGQPLKTFEDFDKVRVGAPKNGISSPSSDVAAAVSRLATLISRRDVLLGILDRTLEQSKEILQINASGSPKLGFKGGLNISSALKKSDTTQKIIADDNANILGHLSGRRLIINDETIVSSNFSERPPEMTHVQVGGTDPIVGEGGGNIAGNFPLYLAIGVDFDLWRQYGFRSDKMIEKPFFWNAEQQCAPYAKMLLSRQRRNIITGNVTVIGNEFYQLGDVVYVSDRQMLYYVNRINHRFTFEGDFQTSLELNYGHPPGEYIPTPLDIIGKSLSNASDKQGAFRTRRVGPGTSPSQDTILGVVKFPSDSKTSVSDLLAGQRGRRNFDILRQAASIAKDELKSIDKDKSPRVVLMTYGDKLNASSQETMASTVKQWFQNPQIGDGGSGIKIGSTATGGDLSGFKIEGGLIQQDRLQQCLPEGKLKKADLDLLKEGVVASPQAYTMDETLKTVVEIRLRRPPPSGWLNGQQS